MNRISFAVAALLAVPVLAARAESPDPAGQFAASPVHNLSSAQVATELAQFRRSGVNPWSSSYNPHAFFRSEKTRSQVRAEFLAGREAVSAMTGEDSGSAFLAAHRQGSLRPIQFTGQSPAPAN